MQTKNDSGLEAKIVPPLSFPLTAKLYDKPEAHHASPSNSDIFPTRKRS